MTRTTYSEKELLVSLKSSDRTERNNALSYIYKNQYVQIAGYIKRNSGNESDAEDIFQEGLTILYEKVLDGTYKIESTIRTYLFAICKNQWSKRLRKSSTKNELYGIESKDIQDDTLMLDTMIADEESETLASLLDSMDCACKRILILYYYENRRMKEIAEMMNLANDGVAKNKKNRCLKKLRALAKQIPGFKPTSNS